MQIKPGIFVTCFQVQRTSLDRYNHLMLTIVCIEDGWSFLFLIVIFGVLVGFLEMLSILMVPTVTRTAQEVLLLVPNDLREAGLAMGATQWRTVASIVVPAARNGLLTATILGVARIAGHGAHR